MSEKISIIVPAFNEENTIDLLVQGVEKVIKSNNLMGELIVVDDGSTDRTGEMAENLSKRTPFLKVVHHRRNLGKSKALVTGFHNSSGNIIIILDADLQYTPEDIPVLLSQMKEKYDLINGWRQPAGWRESFARKIASLIFNFIARKIFGVQVHDYNCGFKAIRREILEEIILRSDYHRYILPLAQSRGYRIGEAKVREFPRKHGKSKFGTERLVNGLMDLISLKLQLTFSERPMLLFGMTGLMSMFAGFLLGIYLIIDRFVYGVAFLQHLPIITLTLLLTLSGVQSFFFGFIAELLSTMREEINKNANFSKKSEAN